MFTENLIYHKGIFEAIIDHISLTVFGVVMKIKCFLKFLNDNARCFALKG
jgi:hypothetical protein